VVKADLRETAEVAEPVKTETNLLIKAETAMPIATEWRQIKAIKSAPDPGNSEITIEIGKSRIRVKEGMDSALLSKVIKVLVELC
jgi:hypothetical protein